MGQVLVVWGEPSPKEEMGFGRGWALMSALE